VTLAQDPQTLSLGIEQYLATLRRRWGVIALCGLLGVALAAGYLFLLAPKATATADLNINVISTEPFNAEKSAGGLLDDAAEARIAQSYAVAEGASKLMGGTIDADEIREASSVTTTSGTSVVLVSYTARSSEDAIRGADAVAQAYLDYRHDQAKKRVDALLADVNSRLSDARSELVTAYEQIADSKSGSGAATKAESNRQQVVIEIQDLIERKNNLEGVDTAGGSILTAAANNSIVYGPRKVYILLIGFLAGVAIGLLCAFVVDRYARHIRRVRDVTHVSGRPTFLTSNAPGLPVDSATRDTLRVARERFTADIDGMSRRVLIVDDSGPFPSQTTLAFAMVMTEDTRPTELILPVSSESGFKELSAFLDLKQVETDPDDADRYDSLSNDSITVSVPHGDLQDAEFFAAEAIPNRREATRDRQVARQILILSSNAAKSDIVWSLRRFDVLVLVHQRGTSRVRNLRAILGEAATFRTPLAGSLLLNHRPRS